MVWVFKWCLKTRPFDNQTDFDHLNTRLVWYSDVHVMYFLVSALKGEGVADLKAFLLKSAYPAPWDFPQELYTDQVTFNVTAIACIAGSIDHY